MRDLPNVKAPVDLGGLKPAPVDIEQLGQKVLTIAEKINAAKAEQQCEMIFQRLFGCKSGRR